MATLYFHDREADLGVNASQLCDSKGEIFVIDIHIEGVVLSFFRDSLEQLDSIDEAIHQAIKDLRMRRGDENAS